MTKHRNIELSESQRTALFIRYPKARNLPTHLTHDHHLDNASLDEWQQQIDAHLYAYAHNVRSVRLRVSEIVSMNMRAARSIHKRT